MVFNIRSKSFNLPTLSSYIENLLLIFRIRTTTKVTGIVSLPTKIKRFTINSSPHIDKKSRDQFEIRTYSKMLTITGDFNEIFSRLIKISIPQGIYIGINIIEGTSKNYINSKWN
ncbi:uS10/mL48 family ribosomal protein [Candidatus Hodgkinia cicadicola]|uniref:Small ribosomal subunit protein uS10 n=1 Tax=Candidatus Hodgkinia cicadicola TaxID=573658 RepID=A0ABX4MGB2_9HYPH|nr:30S ribosomal protein S10 [Candidatus Hodgkinia cicadicola]